MMPDAPPRYICVAKDCAISRLSTWDGNNNCCPESIMGSVWRHGGGKGDTCELKDALPKSTPAPPPALPPCAPRCVAKPLCTLLISVHLFYSLSSKGSPTFYILRFVEGFANRSDRSIFGFVLKLLLLTTQPNTWCSCVLMNTWCCCVLVKTAVLMNTWWCVCVDEHVVLLCVDEHIFDCC
jgi:hypothetical protein